MFVKLIRLLIICSITSVFAKGQNREIDSLLTIVKQNRQDTNLVNTLNLLSKKVGLAVSNYDTTLYYSHAAISAAKKINYKKGMAKAYGNIGLVYFNKGNFSEALKNHFTALSLRKEIGDMSGIANSYTGVGMVYYSQGNYPEALKNYFDALKIRETLLKGADRNGLAHSYNNIGLVYYSQGNYEEALKNYLAAIKIMEAISGGQDKRGIAAGYMNLGNVYLNQSDYTNALKYNFSALKIMQEIGDKQGTAACYGNIAGIYQRQGNYPDALKYNLTSLEIEKEIGNKKGVASSYHNIGSSYIAMGKTREGKQWQETALKLAKEAGQKETIKNSYASLAMTDSLLGNYKSAYANYKLYILYRDSLLNEENTKKTVQQAMQYDFDKKQTADSLKVAEERKLNEVKFEQEKTQRYFLYGGLVLVVLIAGFIFNRFKVTQKQKAIIEAKEIETQKQNVIISEQKHVIEERHKEITDSINYAERIQKSFLATKKHLDENITDYFVLFKPKDVVSGDFYWSATLANGNFALATADSTGHGVPGAIMSLLNITSLEKAIETESSPEKILNITRNIIIERLKKDGSAEGGKDGMDCTLLAFNKDKTRLQIAAANNPVWIIRDAEVIDIKPDKMPVGKHDKQDIAFTLHELELKKGDVIYTLTDGFPDQFGGEKGKKFMSKKLRELLSSNTHLGMNEQKTLLENTFKDWVGNLEQVDDVTVIGIRI